MNPPTYRIVMPAITFADLPPEWIEERREIVARDGYALRAGATFTIEVKSLTTNRWLLLPLPGKACGFTDAAQLALALAALQQ
jgi:hypothetical protein